MIPDTDVLIAYTEALRDFAALLRQVDTTLNVLVKGQEHLMTQLSDVQAAMADFKSSLGTVATDVAEIKADAGTLDTDVAALEAQLQSALQAGGGLSQAQLQAALDSIATVKATATALHTDLSGVHTNLTALAASTQPAPPAPTA
jgi:phage shock protein A